MTNKQIPYGYFEMPRSKYGVGLCSDDECPCNETEISFGTGYVFVSQEVVNFRKDCQSFDEFKEKVKITEKFVSQLFGGADIRVGILGIRSVSPILICKDAAIKT